tara:strand:+ start:250 stop:633 length:384 start_codon:yes stop_codon:yes gene_type:complete
MKNDSKMSSILGPQLEIHGDVKASGSVLIYGKVFGNIDSTGEVKSSRDSFIKGDIKAKEAVVNGNVDGDLVCDGKITLGDTSNLKGNLSAGKLIIEEGAKFDGVCNMNQNTTNTKNQVVEEIAEESK